MFLMGANPMRLQKDGATRAGAIRNYEKWKETSAAQKADANDRIYQFESSGDYNPGPHLEKIESNFDGQPVKFLLVNVGEEEAKIKEFLSGNSVKLDILLDRYSKIAEKYDALSLPRLYVIDKEGIVRKEQKGFSDPEQFEIELTRMLTDLLK
jgi:hypothetical protein